MNTYIYSPRKPLKCREAIKNLHTLWLRQQETTMRVTCRHSIFPSIADNFVHHWYIRNISARTKTSWILRTSRYLIRGSKRVVVGEAFDQIKKLFSKIVSNYSTLIYFFLGHSVVYHPCSYSSWKLFSTWISIFD